MRRNDAGMARVEMIENLRLGDIDIPAAWTMAIHDLTIPGYTLPSARRVDIPWDLLSELDSEYDSNDDVSDNESAEHEIFVGASSDARVLHLDGNFELQHPESFARRNGGPNMFDAQRQYIFMATLREYLADGYSWEHLLTMFGRSLEADAFMGKATRSDGIDDAVTCDASISKLYHHVWLLDNCICALVIRFCVHR
jgi:hypothetical protein